MIPTDWIWGFVGGLMIGGAAAFYLLMNGRILGASGILGGVVDGTGRDAIGHSIAIDAFPCHGTGNVTPVSIFVIGIIDKVNVLYNLTTTLINHIIRYTTIIIYKVT